MTEQELKLQARLFAMEYVIANLSVFLHRFNRSTAERIWAVHDAAKQLLSQQTIAGTDPVQSDQMTDEIQIAVERILSSIEEMAGADRKKGS
jgi:hypothetical protein